ncbi:MAG: bifunctional phosphopantothenoylcysteine decarboxylase/phosphopantothenate--cysteine ligase CoaBC [Gammaproteobacteria bacterium]|nr:bifunctional phosphopantothenoylcysteine decarboxylase/phosphopantothenate--cysteine ligase CoaBC [Gammaproteobacteria bacterium]
MNLQGKHILLGVTGGIAAYKAPALVRELRRTGAEVRVVTTPAAQAFVAPLSLQAVSGHPVRGELFDPAAEAGMDHIALARWADLVLVAPATANFLARLSAGLADDLLTTLCLATAAPIAVAPAMNRQMWQAAATVHNVGLLRERGVHLFGPAEGEQACGETGPGRMLEPLELVTCCAGLLMASERLAGVRVLVTAGPTREALDPVRYISNRSSGRMGFAVAEAAAAAGAAVTLVSGPVDLPTPPGVQRVDVVSAAEMAAAVEACDCDLFIGTAAVADYRPVAAAPEKIKKSAARLTLELERNPDILAGVAARPARPFTVGFAAETEQLETHARDKLARKGLDMIAANDVSPRAEGGFDSAVNALRLFWADGEATLPLQDKRQLAHELVQLISDRYRSRPV